MTAFSVVDLLCAACLLALVLSFCLFPNFQLFNRAWPKPCECETVATLGSHALPMVPTKRGPYNMGVLVNLENV